MLIFQITYSQFLQHIFFLHSNIFEVINDFIASYSLKNGTVSQNMIQDKSRLRYAHVALLNYSFPCPTYPIVIVLGELESETKA